MTTEWLHIGELHSARIGAYVLEVDAHETSDSDLRWWEWIVVGRDEEGRPEPLAEGVSYRSLDEAKACAEAVARVLSSSQT